ncbi:MAG: TenA family protein [Chloroflexi bacterium]|nr:TenA family protein [Chloroflexota bacterium]
MALTQDLKSKYKDLWERMVTHPFIMELGDGTLSIERSTRYFLQDYVFVNDLVKATATAMAKAPDFEAANVLNQFLTGILNPENDLFVRFFKELGASEEQYSSAGASPTTQAFGDFLVRTAVDGPFEDIITALYVTEGTYLDWGTRFLQAGKRPTSPVYREWIDLHSPDVLGGLVNWMEGYLDSLNLGDRLPDIDRIFHTTLRYEYQFWESAYHGEAWPDD